MKTMNIVWKTRGRNPREFPLEYPQFENPADILAFQNDGGTLLTQIVNEYYINKAKEIVNAEDLIEESYISLAKTYQRKLKKLGKEISAEAALAKVKQLEMLA